MPTPLRGPIWHPATMAAASGAMESPTRHITIVFLANSPPLEAAARCRRAAAASDAFGGTSTCFLLLFRFSLTSVAPPPRVSFACCCPSLPPTPSNALANAAFRPPPLRPPPPDGGEAGGVATKAFGVGRPRGEASNAASASMSEEPRGSSGALAEEMPTGDPQMTLPEKIGAGAKRVEEGLLASARREAAVGIAGGANGEEALPPLPSA